MFSNGKPVLHTPKSRVVRRKGVGRRIRREAALIEDDDASRSSSLLSTMMTARGGGDSDDDVRGVIDEGLSKELSVFVGGMGAGGQSASLGTVW